MEQGKLWALLTAATAILLYVIFKPTAHQITFTEIINAHAHRTHYFFADPKALKKIFPDYILSMMLKDGWVEGEGRDSVEVYEMPVNTSLSVIGLQNLTVMVQADVRHRQSAHVVTIIPKLVWGQIYWSVEETGPTLMESRVRQEVTVVLPALCWALYTAHVEHHLTATLRAALHDSKRQLEDNMR